MPAALDLTPDLAGLTATLVYVVVFGFVFVESGLLIGFLLPGDSLLFAAGLLSATEGSGVSLTVLVIGVLVAAVAGDSVGYAFGARLGRPWLERRAAGGRLDARHLRRAEASTSGSAGSPSWPRAGSRGCAPSPRSWPGRRGCPTAGSSPRTSSAPSSGGPACW